MTPAQIAESFHLAFLQSLSVRVNRDAWALKGGSNLRFFYSSVRYSEDIDLDTFDIEPWIFQDRIDQVLAGDLLKRTLAILGSRIDYTNPKERSDTKSKWIVGLAFPSETELVYTKIEVSHREYPYRAFVKIEPVLDQAIKPYAAALRPPTFGHYLPSAAIPQKIVTLGDLDVRRTRDVFDLDLLFRLAPHVVKRGDVDEDDLRAAIARAYEMEYGEFVSKVLNFLEPEMLPVYQNPDEWDSIRLGVIEHLSELLP